MNTRSRKPRVRSARQDPEALAALNRIGQFINRLAAPAELLELIFEAIGQILDNRNLYIALYDPAQNYISFPIYTIQGERRTIQGRTLTQAGLTDFVIRTRAPLFIPRRMNATLKKIKIPGFGLEAKCFLAVPMMVGDQVIGVIAVQDYERENIYTARHLAVLTTIAAQAAMALENARLYASIQNELSARKRAEEETLRRVDQFAALVETTRDIALQSDLASLLELIVGHAIRLLGASRGTMYLYDPVRNQVELTVEQGGFNKIKTRLDMGEGVAGRVALTRQSLIVDDYREWENRSAQFDGLPIRAVMGVPMLFGGELLGVLVVSEVGSAERKFNEGDARLLSLFAGQAASAVHNARLIEETRVRAEQLTMVYDAGLTLNRVLDLNVQLEFLLQTAMRALRAERAEIFLWDAAQRQSEMKFALGFTPERLREMQAARFPLDPEKSLLGWVIENHLPLNVPDVFADPRYIVIDPEIQSMLFVPVQHEQQLRGVLAALSTRRDAFSAQDERLLILFSNQVAVAMENARLFADARQRVQELTLINQISATINQPLALADVLNNTLRELARALKVDRAGLAVLAENRRHLTVIAEYNALPGSTAQGEKIPVADNPSMEFILRERRPLAVSDVSTDPMLASVAPLLRQVGALSILILPLVVNDQVIGTIGLDSTRAVRVFTDAEIALAQTIANQALGTIERARLLEQMERHAAQLSAVNELGRAVAETVDRAQIFQRVYEAARRIFPDTATMFISLYDSARQTIAGVFGMQDDQPVNVAELPVIPLLPPGEGTQSQVIHTRAPLIVNDLNAQLKDAPVVVYVGTEGDQTRSAVYAPMLSKGNVIGVIQIQSYALERYQPADAELLSVIANSAAIAIENAQLFNETQRRLEQMQALRVVDLAIKGSLDLKLTLSVLLEQAVTNLRMNAAAVLLLEPRTQMLEYAAGRGFRTHTITRSRLRLNEGLAGRAALEQRTIIISNLNETDQVVLRRKLFNAEGFVAYFAAPLVVKGRVEGVLEFFHRAPFTPDAEWIEFLASLAGQAALAIDNAQLFENLQRSNLELTLAYDATIEGWSHALDLRERETEGHAQRVVDLTLRLARALGIGDEELVHIRRGALLHDIGKMGIPDEILLKTTALTEADWRVMRQHTTHAFELLSPIAFLRPALDIPYAHHERWDGSGYPRGLGGDAIPLAARVFAVVDVWDALNSARPYRPAWTKNQALDYLRAGADKEFDPRAVTEFLKIIAEEDGG